MKQLKLIIAALFLISPMAANAVPILVGTTTDATGINGLVIGGVEYDATFSFLSFEDTYGSNTPAFFGDLAGATDAATALAVALTAFGVTGLNGVVQAFDRTIGLSVPFAEFPANGQINEAIAFSSVTPGDWGIYAPGGCVICNVNVLPNPGFGWVVFDRTQVPVPEPGTLALLGLGLAGIGMTRRRKKA